KRLQALTGWTLPDDATLFSELELAMGMNGMHPLTSPSLVVESKPTADRRQQLGLAACLHEYTAHRWKLLLLSVLQECDLPLPLQQQCQEAVAVLQAEGAGYAQIPLIVVAFVTVRASMNRTRRVLWGLSKVTHVANLVHALLGFLWRFHTFGSMDAFMTCISILNYTMLLLLTSNIQAFMIAFLVTRLRHMLCLMHLSQLITPPHRTKRCTGNWQSLCKEKWKEENLAGSIESNRATLESLEKSETPCVNPMLPHNVQTWVLLRTVLRRTGFRYDRRLQLYLLMMSFMTLFCFVAAFLYAYFHALGNPINYVDYYLPFEVGTMKFNGSLLRVMDHQAGSIPPCLP
ncbi:hypothetical protein CYMTET_31616, partial [Cymbomonas tetramitiformis]